MSRPHLYLGRGDNGSVYQTECGYTDDGTPYTAKITSNLFMPGGPGEEGIFTAAYLALTHRLEPVVPDVDPTDTVAVSVTPIIDGVRGATETFNVKMRPRSSVSPPALVQRTYEVAFSEPVMRGLVEVGRRAPRGRGLQVEIAMNGTDILIDGVLCEHEVVRETLVPV